MELHEFILICIALFVIGTDVFVRLGVGRSRRDWFVARLLETLSPVRTRHYRSHVPEVRDTEVLDSLLEHFDQSFASRNIVATLASSPKGMTQKELERDFAETATKTGKPALPARVLRKIIMILLEANLVQVSGGKIRTTRLGEDLHALLETRKAA